uniref:Error-prone DNA polymerase n=1 Tax=freshwater metagenome TaxID=449393 RepID=A0A6J5ZYU4_9ZZZZ
MAGPEAMKARFEDHPEAVAETERVAARCNFDLTSDLGYRYPGAEDGGADRDLVQACQASFDNRYPPGHKLRDEAAARLTEELKIIAGLGLSGFFLLHRDMLELAREVAVEVRGPDSARALLPPGRGRGSSVSSIVCYLTGLSHVDPVANRLLLGRFLSEQITELPDIDLDFPRDIREKLIPRIHKRYGTERTALVAAFPTYKARGAIRDFGAALGLPAGEIERVARSSEGWSLRGFDQQIAEAIGEERAQSGRWRWLAALAREASGLPRHLAQHSGGMIVATRPLIDCCPVVPSAIEGRQIAHWDKDSCSDAGFLKIDLLGLGMLSAVERCVEQIDARRGERIDLSRIPYDDPEVYEAIQRGETTGVFQIESRAQISSLRRTRPTNLDEITIQVAIVRPGPIQGGAVNPYIKRRQALNANPDYKIPYPHHSLEPILRETLGTIIFQDQVIEVAMAFAGFSASEAAGLRRAMSRKRSAEAIESHRRSFIEGASARWGDVDEAQAVEVFEMVAGFAGFGFPKAHAAAFGLLAYQSTWLRVHYGPELVAALLDEQPMGFYPPDSLVHEAQRRGTTVLAPEINQSGIGCLIDDHGALRLGLRHVRGVRGEQLEELIEERSANGPFGSLSDLAARAGGARSSLEALAWAGACDALATEAEARRPGLARRAVLWRLGVGGPPAVSGQLSLGLELPAAPKLNPLSSWQTMLADYAATGLTTGSHPLALMRPDLDRRGALRSVEMEQAPHRSRVRTGGLVVARQRPGTAGGVCFILLEDEEGTINLVLKPKVYDSFRLAVRTEPLLFAEGVLERHASAGGTVNLVVDRIEPLEPGDAQLAEVGELVSADFRAVAPAVMSFAQGRRR